MTTKYETEKGTLIEEQDLWAENPREWREPFGKFYTWLRRSCSPDKCPYNDARDFISAQLPKGWEEIDQLYTKGKFDEGNELLVKKMKNKGIFLLPVWKFEHGDVTYLASVKNPFSCPFDSCMAGYIFAKRKKLQTDLGIKPGTRGQDEKMAAALKGEVDLYTAYVNNEVYGYRLEDSEGNTVWPEESDPENPDTPMLEWGFYGDVYQNGIMEELGITKVKMI